MQIIILYRFLHHKINSLYPHYCHQLYINNKIYYLLDDIQERDDRRTSEARRESLIWKLQWNNIKAAFSQAHIFVPGSSVLWNNETADWWNSVTMVTPLYFSGIIYGRPAVHSLMEIWTSGFADGTFKAKLRRSHQRLPNGI